MSCGSALDVGIYMIKVTRINGKEFYVNSSLIEFIESTPDTVITLTTEKKLVVSEGVDEIIERILAYEQRKLKLPNQDDIMEREVK